MNWKETLQSPGVRIDEAHCALIAGLIRAQKPTSVLEFGFGGGASCDAIQSALQANRQHFTHILVDNWADWGGNRPDFAVRAGVTFFNMAEGAFTTQCEDSFDFIFSDADHYHAQEWFIHTYACLLNPGGILCYHDVRAFPNLTEIVSECQRLGLRHVVFDKNSLPYEACQRGLLVIFKPAEES